ncbi:MAG TPA: TonB-dependent receptor, partial [Thermoanaerobaculia bacterium]
VSDAPAAGVTVTVSSAVLQHPRSTLTNARGMYWLEALPHGEYEVTFSRTGLTSLTRRAVLQVARTARADATLEPSEDEDTVTSTARTPSVVDTIAVTTNFDAETLDRLPVRREVYPVGNVAPPTSQPLFGRLDDVFLGNEGLIAEDALDEVTVLRGALPVELDAPLIAARTRAPREQFFLTLRDTLTSTEWVDDRFSVADESDDDVKHHVDLTAGGRIVPQRLWFFGAAWLGDEADVFRDDQRGALLKLTGSPAAAHTLTATYFEARSTFRGIPRNQPATTSLRYTGAFGPQLTAEVQAARIPTFNPGTGAEETNAFDARGSWFAGDHVLSAGGSHFDLTGGALWSLFAADRWSAGKWNVYAGVRHQETRIDAQTLPRLAVTYDVRGDARHALTASFGRYSGFPGVTSVAAIGYAYAFAANGHARADLVRREGEAFEVYEAQLEGRYRLFDRFETGGSYTYLDHSFFDRSHHATGWAGLELPFGEHELGLTVLQRLISGEFAGPVPGGSPQSDTLAPTDFALRYSLPISRTHVTLAADWTNVLAVNTSPAESRALRFWVRLRL